MGTYRKFLLLPVFILCVAVFRGDSSEERMCVCHVENRNTGKGHVIEVDSDSLEGHLKHGDTQCDVDCKKALGESCNIRNGGKCK